jgi:hypothetical protein
MRVWLACFLVLFALAELFDWLQKFNLPLPIYILGGAFLAVASNYDRIFEQPQLDSITPSTNPISFPITSPVEDTQTSQTDD